MEIYNKLLLVPTAPWNEVCSTKPEEHSVQGVPIHGHNQELLGIAVGKFN